MILKALSFNRKVLEENFNPYILDTIHVTVDIIKKILDQVPPDSNEVDFVTYANLISALTFETHPTNRNDKIHREFLKLDQNVYQTLLENIFVQLNYSS